MSNNGAQYGEITKALWMTLLREGGRWKPADLVEVLPAGQPRPTHAGGSLSSMERMGHCKSYREQGSIAGRVYGVTMECCVPKNVTLTELTALLRAGEA